MKRLQNDNNGQVSLFEIINSNPIRATIVGLLIIYPELSFTDLSKKVGRSKSTIHPHVKELEKHGIIYVSKEERHGGNPSKFYSYNRESARDMVVDTIDKSNGINDETALKIINKEKNKMLTLKDMIEMYINFWQILEDNLEQALLPQLFLR